ncbi:hypothetical protein AC1031_004810 [Aphanomyces cochlioides]|nr:hypothetical protein AC1031_004810 [Aphanomyces cochlioides]
MRNIFKAFEAQRPSLPSTPHHRYQPSLHLTKSEIADMIFPDDHHDDSDQPRRKTLVAAEKTRRHSLMASTSDYRKAKPDISYEYVGEHLLAKSAVVLFEPVARHDDELGGRHSMPANRYQLSLLVHHDADEDKARERRRRNAVMSSLDACTWDMIYHVANRTMRIRRHPIVFPST